MPSDGDRVPHGRDAERRWRQVPWRARRRMLAGGQRPADEEQAVAALGYARRLRERSPLWAVVGAMAALVVSLALAMVVEDGLTRQSFVIAGGIGVGVGLGLEIMGRIQSGKLRDLAEEVLAGGR